MQETELLGFKQEIRDFLFKHPSDYPVSRNVTVGRETKNFYFIQSIFSESDKRLKHALNLKCGKTPRSFWFLIHRMIDIIELK